MPNRLCPIHEGSCYEERCALWFSDDDGNERCSIRDIAETLELFRVEGVNVYVKEG